jgi:hypothetical protein
MRPFAPCFGGWGRWPASIGSAPVRVNGAVHDLMPVILDPDGYDLWLDLGMMNVAAASERLKPYDARQMRSYPVSTRINRVVNDDPEWCACGTRRGSGAALLIVRMQATALAMPSATNRRSPSQRQRSVQKRGWLVYLCTFGCTHMLRFHR